MLSSQSIGIMVPTKGRPSRLKELYNSWLQHTEGHSEFVVGIDAEEKELYEWVKDTKIIVIDTPSEDYVKKANFMAERMTDYDYLYLLGDDFVINSRFESVFLDYAEENCVLYGDDGLVGNRMSTACFIDNNIVRAIGYIAPPTLVHYFADNVWSDWGKALGTFKYIPGIKVTHNHHLKNKSLNDHVYKESDQYFKQDQIEYGKYIHYSLAEDIKKVLWKNQKRSSPDTKDLSDGQLLID